MSEKGVVRRAIDNVPASFNGLVALALTGILAFSLVALPLAMLGWFYPAPVFIGTVLAWAALWRLWQPSEPPKEERPSRWAMVVALLIILVVTGVNVRFASQHLLTGRDPGVYVTTGRWLAHTGTLLVDSHDHVYQQVENAELIGFGETGYYHGFRDDGRIYPQFAHLLPTWLGAGAWLGGSRGMFKVNALLGGIALLAVFAFASRLMGPWLAVGALAALSVNLAQVYFTRDAYTEILTQGFLFGGLWVLWQARATYNSPGALLAGLLLGATVMARMDSSLIVVPLIAYVFYELWRSGESRQPGRVRSFVAALMLGVTATSLLGWLDLRLFSPPYVSGRFHLMRELLVLAAALTLAGLLAFTLRRKIQSLISRLQGARPWLATAAMVCVILGAIYAFAVWPSLGWGPEPTPHQDVAMFQEWEGVEIDPSKSYADQGLRRIGQYIGLPGLVLAITGLALMSRRTVMGKESRAVLFLLILAFVSTVYVVRLAITPDQIWAMRRFLPVTIPGFVVLAFWMIDRWFGWAANLRRPDLLRVPGYAAAGLLILVPLLVLAPVAGVRSHVGMLRATESLCDRLPEDAAVLVARADLLDLEFVQAVRSFCQVPAAHVPMDEPLEWYEGIARAWEAEGRSLYAVSSVPDFGTHWPLGAEQITSIEYERLERTVERVPNRFVTHQFSLYLRQVSAPTVQAGEGGSEGSRPTG